MRIPKLWKWKKSPEQLVEVKAPGGGIDDEDDDVMLEDRTTPHKSHLPKNVHVIIITILAVAIGGATYYSSLPKQPIAVSGDQAATSKDLTPEEANKKGQLAQQMVTQAQGVQESEYDKKKAAGEDAKKKFGATSANGQLPASTASTSVPYNATGGQPVAGSAPQLDSNGLPPPPPPIANGPYNPAGISQSSIAQASTGDDAVRNRSSSIIALQGSSGPGAGGASLGTDTAKVATGAAKIILDTVAAQNVPTSPGMSPWPQQRSFPAQVSLDDLRQQIQSLRQQYPSLGSASAAPFSQATTPSVPAAASSLAPQQLMAPVGLPQETRQAPFIEAIRYDGRTVLRQGHFIPAAFQTAINSDLAGDINAVVTEDVYDSIEGTSLLIPKGSKLIATYGSDVLVGQERILISFNRLLLPNGDYVQLGSMNGVDPIGQSGAGAEVNNHFLKQFGAGIVGAIVSWGVDNTGSTNVTINNPAAGGTDLTTSTGKVLKEITDRILDRYKNIKPTLTVAPGEKIKLFVGSDIRLPIYQSQR